MKKSLFVLYASLLLSIYVIRSFNISSKNSGESGNSFLEAENLLTPNQTSNYRQLQSSTQGQNPNRIKVCSGVSTSTVSKSQVQKFKDAYDEYRGAFGPEIGDELIKDQKVPESSKLVQKGIILGLLVVFLIFTPIMSFCYCCYCCCDKKCPCCCKDDMEKNPFTKKQMVYTLIGVVLFSALTVATSIAGYIYSNDINSSYKSMKCVVVSSLDDLNLQQSYTTQDGNPANFIGLNNLSTQVQTITDEIDSYFTNINSFSTWSNTQSTKIQDVSKVITNMFGALNTLPGVFTANHQKAVNSGFNSLMINSDSPSVFYGSGYSDLVKQMTTAQDQASSEASKSMQEAAKQAKQFVDSNSNSNSIKQPLIDGKAQIKTGQDQIAKYVDQVSNDTESIDQAFNLITYFLLAFYGVFIFIAVVSSIASFIGYMKSMLKFRYCLNVFWSLLCLLTFVGFILCIVLGILTIAFMETCNTTDKIFNDKTYLQSFSQLTEDDISYLTTCKSSLGGSGDILKKFNIQDKVDQMTKTQTDLQKSYDSFNLDVYKNFESYMEFFRFQHETMQKYGIFSDRSDQDWAKIGPSLLAKYNIILDYKEATVGYQNQVSNLNNTKNNEAYACISSTNLDQFVIQKNQCTNQYTDLNPTPTEPNYLLKLNGRFCINWDEIQPFSNLETDVKSRYSDCVTVWDNFYKKFVDYVGYSSTRFTVPETFTYQDASGGTQNENKLRALFIESIQKQQSSDSANYPNGFGSLLYEFKNKVNDDILKGSTKISDALTGKDGLLNNVNCLFFGATLDNMQNTMCAENGLTIYNTFKIMCVLTFSNFVLIIYLYKMSMKLLGKQKELWIQESKPQNTKQPVKEQEFEQLNIN